MFQFWEKVYITVCTDHNIVLQGDLQLSKIGFSVESADYKGPEIIPKVMPNSLISRRKTDPINSILLTHSLYNTWIKQPVNSP